MSRILRTSVHLEKLFSLRSSSQTWLSLLDENPLVPERVKVQSSRCFASIQVVFHPVRLNLVFSDEKNLRLKSR